MVIATCCTVKALDSQSTKFIKVFARFIEVLYQDEVKL